MNRWFDFSMSLSKRAYLFPLWFFDDIKLFLIPFSILAFTLGFINSSLMERIFDLVLVIKSLLSLISEGVNLNFKGLASTILIVSSKSSRSHSILLMLSFISFVVQLYSSCPTAF